jgi:hypothetical protein
MSRIIIVTPAVCFKFPLEVFFCLFRSEVLEQLHFVPNTLLTSRHFREQKRDRSQTVRNDVAVCVPTRDRSCSRATHPHTALPSILRI